MQKSRLAKRQKSASSVTSFSAETDAPGKVCLESAVTQALSENEQSADTQNGSSVEISVAAKSAVIAANETDTRRVLIVDDNVQVLRVLVMMLEREGFEVLQAQDGGRALELFHENRPQLVVLDYFMPVRDGFQVLREIRRTADANEVPVIMVTSKGLESDIEEAFNIGASDYVTKPFSPRELAARIKARYASSVNARSRS
jgi:PleD family two-component response regulator